METFKKYYDNLIHPEYEYCQEAHAVVKWSVDGKPEPTFMEQNETNPPDKRHVEHVVLEKICKDITEMKKNKPPVPRETRNEGEASMSHKISVHVQLFMNYSPCNSTKYTPADDKEAYATDIKWPEEGLTCCDALIAFRQRDDIKVTLEVVFVSLYMIARKSCMKDENCVGKHYTAETNRDKKKKNKSNEEGLKNLKKKGVGLRTFSINDWKFVRRELKVEEEDEAYKALEKKRPMADRLKEDERMKKDLEAIVGPDEELEGTFRGMNLGKPTEGGASGDSSQLSRQQPPSQ